LGFRVDREIAGYRRYVQRFAVPGREELAGSAAGAHHGASASGDSPAASNQDGEMLQP
jgi:hypothetical protein